jgi:hypothetical protein
MRRKAPIGASVSHGSAITGWSFSPDFRQSGF